MEEEFLTRFINEDEDLEDSNFDDGLDADSDEEEEEEDEEVAVDDDDAPTEEE